MTDAPVFHDETFRSFQFLLIVMYDMRTCLFLCVIMVILSLSIYTFGVYVCLRTLFPPLLGIVSGQIFWAFRVFLRFLGFSGVLRFSFCVSQQIDKRRSKE